MIIPGLISLLFFVEVIGNILLQESIGERLATLDFVLLVVYIASNSNLAWILGHYLFPDLI
jgi:hypothetical protein